MALKVCITNQKGGVGKTTTTYNLAHGLSIFYGLNVLMIDCDSQGHLTNLCSIDITKNFPSLFDVLIEEKGIEEVIVKRGKGPDILPSNMNVAGADMKLASTLGREFILQKELEKVIPEYDVILIDCSPSLSIVNVNALVSSDCIVIPTSPDYLNYFGMSMLFKVINEIKNKLNVNLRIGGIVITRYVGRFKITKSAMEYLNNSIKDQIFETKIRENVRLKEFPATKMPIFEYDKDCNGSLDYKALTIEFVEKELRPFIDNIRE